MANNFEIRDAYALKQSAGDLAQVNQNMRRVNEQLLDCMNEISANWESDTADRESYITSVTTNIEKIGNVADVVKSLSFKLENFADNAIREANNG